MTDNTVPVIGPFRVWTLPPTQAGVDASGLTAYTFPWNWAWEQLPRLIPLSFTDAPGGMGGASFQLLRKTRQEPNDTQFRSMDGVVVGQYICITADKDVQQTDAYGGKTPSLDPAKILWCGWLNQIDYELATNNSDGNGSASALGLGYLLDSQQLTGWQASSANQNGYGSAMGAPPTANIGLSDSVIVGNGQYGSVGNSNVSIFLFSSNPDECTKSAVNIWTRWRLLYHAATVCAPAGLAPLTISAADGSATGSNPSGTSTIAGYLNDTSVPEVFDLRDLTMKGAIDLCVPRARLLGWSLTALKESWQVTVYSLSGDSTPKLGGIPANSGTYSASPTSDTTFTGVRVTEDGTDVPDEVWIEGGRHVVGATVGFPDGSLDIGWKKGDAEQEGLFKYAAASANGYNSLSYDEKTKRNAAVRAGPALRDVYARYRLKVNEAGGVIVKRNGDGSGGAVNLVPLVAFANGSLTITNGGKCPYIPTTSLLRTLPWFEGVQADGTDKRILSSISTPSFLTPRVFKYNSAATGAEPKWEDLDSQNGVPGYYPVSLEMEDGGASLRIVTSDNTRLALGHWTDTVTPADAPGSQPDSDPKAHNYSHLVFTVAVESDQRVLVKKYRYGISDDSQVRRRLVLRDEKLQLWLMPVGTPLGLNSAGAPDTAAAGGVNVGDTNADVPNYTSKWIIVRNDYPTAKRRLDMAAAWAFRTRRAVEISLGSPHLPPTWAKVGCTIVSIVSPNAATTTTAADPDFIVNSSVESVTTDCKSGRISIRTVIPPNPFASSGSGGGSPSIGGATSLALGGTVAQAIQATRDDVADLERSNLRTPIIFPKTNPAPSQMFLIIDQGNTLDSGQPGIRHLTTLLTSITAYDPNVTTSFVDGIGRARLVRDGVLQTDYVLVCNDVRSLWAASLLRDDTIAVAAIISIGGVTCYLPI